jgi:hypothetical protein
MESNNNNISPSSIETITQVTSSAFGRNDQKSFDEDPNFFMWIRNDGLLRDEGILFGQAQDNPEPKIGVIRQYFKQRSDQLRIKIDENESDLEQLKLKKNNIESKLEFIKNIDHNQAEEILKSYIPNVIILSIYAMVLLFNYPLLYYYIKPIHQDSTWVVTTALFLFGCLAVFQTNSLMFHANKDAGTEGEKPERWKLWLQEIGVPAVVVLLLFNILLVAHPINTVLSVCFFELLFFILVGKGFRREFQKLNLVKLENKAISKRQEIYLKKVEENKKNLDLLQSEKDTLESDIEKLRIVYLETKQEFSMNEARSETCVKLFLSEFELAKATRNLTIL